MSSNMVPNVPGVPNLRNFLPRLPNMQIANQALTQEQEVEALPEWQQLFLAGAPEVDVERARQYEGLYGAAGTQNIAAGLGVQPPQERRGLLESFTDYATRLQSASTGFFTGLAGMERRRETTGTGGAESGALFDRPESVQGGLGLALERFAQGLSGDEKFQAADFGALAYDRETAGLGERFLKSAAGFVLDTALDPVTYLSMGGSILGRRIGASAVNKIARKHADDVIATLDDAAKATTFRNGVLRVGTDDVVLTNTVRQLAPELAPKTGLMSTDDALAALATVPGALDNIAADALAATSGAMYRSFGPGGLYKYLSDEFGPAGIQLWRQLPNDIKGGVRFRVPLSGLYRRAMGQTDELGGAIPYAIRIPGTGTGTISRKLGTDKINNGLRSWFRSKRLLKTASNELSGATGASNMATAEAIYRRSRGWLNDTLGVYDPKVDDKLRAVSWRSTEELEDATRLLRAGALSRSAELLADMQVATKAYREGRGKDAAKFDDYFDVALKADINRAGGKTQSIEEVFGVDEADELQQLAFQSADSFQKMLLGVEFQMRDLANADAGFLPNFIENYWPRIMDDIESELGGRPMASAFGNLRNRSHFVAEFNEDGSVKRWMTPKEIAAQLGDKMFIEDAEKLMTTYVVSMNKFLQEERFFQSLLERGVLFRGGREALSETLDITAASRAWQDAYNKMLAGRRALTSMGRGRKGDALDASRLTGPQLRLMEAEAEQVATAFQAGRKHGRKLLEQYRKLSDSLWRAGDGTTIRMLMDNGYPVYRVERLFDGVTKYLTPDGRWTKNEDYFNPFMDLNEAIRTADTKLITQRSRMFIEQIEELRHEFLRDVALAVKNRGDMRRNGLNPLNPANITPANQDQFFAQISDVINKYGSDAGLKSRQVMARAYRDQKFGGGRGGAYTSAALGSKDGPRVRQYWQNRMETMGIFGAETLVDDVRRMFAAIEKPSRGKQWINDWYMPFYAAQKALMTSQRGPGYVIRNIQGGMWNAYLIGTTARHWRLSGTAKVAEMQARKTAEKQAPGDLAQQGVIANREFRRILKEKLGDGRGDKIADAWIAFEKRGLRGRDLTSMSEGTIATAGASGLRGNFRRPLDADEMNFVQRASQTITDDWWWAKTMGAAAQGSEDYLRFGAFLRGVDMYGLDDGGRAAALMVKATQFDYADLSDFESNVVKMLVPFYTWSRNNVPLQFRAAIAEPGKVQKAIRLNDALADAFGEEDEPDEPLPAYVRERFGWRIRKDLWSGPMGDAISGGMVVGEPMVDLNRMIGSQTATGALAGPMSVFNWREVANQLNPLLGTTAEALTGVERSTGGRMPLEEEAPRWLEIFNVGRESGDGRVVNARALRVARELLPPIGIVERYAAPLLGNERMQRRWYTTLASAIFGIPVSTLDPYQTGAELRNRQTRLQSGLKREFGDDTDRYTSYVRRALREGASPDEMEIVIKQGLLKGRNIQDVPVEELDETAMVDTLRFMRRMMQMQENGAPRETIDLMIDYFKPRTDAEQGVRAGKTPPLTPEQLATLGETSASVAAMSPEERLALLKKWMEKNPEWGTALP